jgi:hypothetical protein
MVDKERIDKLANRTTVARIHVGDCTMGILSVYPKPSFPLRLKGTRVYAEVERLNCQARLKYPEAYYRVSKIFL